jgi:nucleoside 2-deoxyribosyltransferase
MKAYLAIKYHKDFKNKEMIDRISSILELNGYSVACIVKDEIEGRLICNSPQELMQLTFEMIKSSNLVVIELTEKGVGLGIEAGYAFAQGIPIVTVAKIGSDISETLEGISIDIIQYEGYEELETLLKDIAKT